MSGLRATPNVFSIPPGAPFLQVLVDALLTGRLVEGFAPQDDPLALAGVTIWVPTRRAVRALASEFVERLDGQVALLPDIRALGDDDEELDLFPSGGGTTALNKPAMPPLERQLLLAKLIEGWATQLNAKQRALIGGGSVALPASPASTVAFAGELAALMDTVATEEVDWASLKKIDAGDSSDWWQLTLTFLEIATRTWPDILAERGMEGAAVQRVEAIRARAAAYLERPPAGPVIAAGSTGSIPATADLLNTIARLPQGALVLPGLDRDMTDEVWSKVDLADNECDESGTAPGHPQFGLRKLLRDPLNTDRGSVDHLGGIDDESAGFARVREELVNAAMLPSAATDAWPQIFGELDDRQRAEAFAGISVVEAAGEREEALAIALALREALETKEKTAALVTPDRRLARRVAVELQRFGIEADDSAGQPLANLPSGTLAQLVCANAGAQVDPVALVSLLKHPLVRFGATPAKARNAARMLELVLLRGNSSPPSFGALEAAVQQRQEAGSDGSIRRHRAVSRMSPGDWDDAIWLARQLDAVFAPDADDEATPLDVLAQELVARLEACAMDDERGLVPLYGSDDGRALRVLLADLLAHGGTYSARMSEWPDLFGTLLAQQSVRRTVSAHPRLAILGPIEARLQTFGRVVLGSLNEGSWPAAVSDDPFLSRPMKQVLGLPAPERRTGLAAHDVQMLLGMEEVVLTRSKRTGTAPGIASRWLQRLDIAAGKASDEMRARGRRFLDWARDIDLPDGKPVPCATPEPRPPVDVRPTGLSITEIETWIRDPYAIYAKHVLNLQPLDGLSAEFGVAERGTLYHAIMEDFAGHLNDGGAHDLASLLAIARRRFDAADVPPAVRAVWWPRFEEIAGHVLDWHEPYRLDVATITTEASGKTDAGLDGFVLRGRADRIDRLRDGTLSILDFKTGTTPSASQANQLHAPQLPLTAAMCARGAFGEDLVGEASNLAYVRLRPSSEKLFDALGRGKDGRTVKQIVSESWEQLQGLVAAYRKAERGYLSKARPFGNETYGTDYDHLARVLEWSAGGPEGDE